MLEEHFPQMDVCLYVQIQISAAPGELVREIDGEFPGSCSFSYFAFLKPGIASKVKELIISC